tara:strand:+ start:1261 stop:1617 length:357 start_codon:yes stop_codon:yes gene_type:complete
MARKKSTSLCATKLCRNKRLKDRRLCSKCSLRRWRSANPVKARLFALKDRARRKKLAFDLDHEWLAGFLAKNGYDPALHHIDRICVLGGYVKTNLQVLPISDNIAKGNRERHGQAYAF